MEGEASGYDIYSTLRRKGIKAWPNNVYTALVKMERDGLLKGRWVGGQDGHGLRKHLYALNGTGESSLNEILTESLDLLMSAFVRASLMRANRPENVRGVAWLLNMIGMDRRSMANKKLVVAVPRYNPLVCFPTMFYHLNSVYPEALIYVVRPPGIKFEGERTNLTFLDGHREKMPLRDGFADYVILEGFPRSSTMESTVAECMRVLRAGGHLCTMVSKVMTKEEKPQYVSFGEFVSSLYYDLHDQDRMVSMDGLKRLLSLHFGEIKDAEVHGNAAIWAINMRDLLQPIRARGRKAWRSKIGS